MPHFENHSDSKSEILIPNIENQKFWFQIRNSGFQKLKIRNSDSKSEILILNQKFWFQTLKIRILILNQKFWF